MSTPPEFNTIEDIYQYNAEHALRDPATDPCVKRWACAKHIVYIVLIIVLLVFYYRFDQLLAKLE